MDGARILADGLAFPEGPVCLPDGDLLVVELMAGRLTRIAPDGGTTTVADLGGGPNGAAIGPDGAIYVCNNGGHAEPEQYIGGRIQRVELGTGSFDDLYLECDGHPLRRPNDLVFDGTGGFWFTDLGHRHHRQEDLGGVYYAQADGSAIHEVAFGLHGANGIGLSPAGDRLYVAETYTGRLWAWSVSGPGQVAGEMELVVGLPGHQLFDSLAVEAGGNVCVGTLLNAGITVVTPDGDAEHVPVPDPTERYVTNICFGGDELRTAHLTLATTGTVLVCDWPRPGLPLAFS